VIELPDTLCIHLKRFRHDFAFSSKISTKVVFPLQKLDMSPWIHRDYNSPQVKQKKSTVLYFLAGDLQKRTVVSFSLGLLGPVRKGRKFCWFKKNGF
jgi:hypothetical protein